MTMTIEQRKLLDALKNIASEESVNKKPVDNLAQLLDSGRPLFGDLHSARIWPLILSAATLANKYRRARGTPEYDPVKEQHYLGTLRENLKLF